MTKSQREAFRAKIASEPLWALEKLEDVTRWAGQADKRAIVRQVIEERKAGS